MLYKFILCRDEVVDLFPKYYSIKNVNFLLWTTIFRYNGHKGFTFETTYPNIHNFLTKHSEQGYELSRGSRRDNVYE